MSQADLLSTVDDLLDSLDDVEDALEPLLSKSLQESLASAPGPVERAKVLFWLAYTLHSCVWAYTKTAAEDPEQHGVLDELKRIQGYNRKLLAAAERAKKPVADSSESTAEPEASTSSRRLPIDKDAASRFITAAIANQAKKPSVASKFYTAESTVQDPLTGPGPHSRLSSLARASERVGKNAESVTSASSAAGSAQAGETSSEEEDLQVFADEQPLQASDGHDVNERQTDGSKDILKSRDSPAKGSKKRKKKSSNEEAQIQSVETSKYVRYDPLQGYGADPAAKKKKKASKPESSDVMVDTHARSVGASNEAILQGSGQEAKKQKKRRKGDKSATGSPKP